MWIAMSLKISEHTDGSAALIARNQQRQSALLG
jgi:hypothetical protein